MKAKIKELTKNSFTAHVNLGGGMYKTVFCNHNLNIPKIENWEVIEIKRKWGTVYKAVANINGIEITGELGLYNNKGQDNIIFRQSWDDFGDGNQANMSSRSGKDFTRLSPKWDETKINKIFFRAHKKEVWNLIKKEL